MAERSRASRPLTRAKLEAAALRHLERHPASRMQLERVLERRVERALRAHPDADAETWRSWVPEVVARCERLGYIDDARFAVARRRRLRKRGASTRKIRAALRTRGVDESDVEAGFAEEGEDAELDAARRYAQRRRFGPWRRGEGDLQRELAALGRAGFSYGVARKALEEEGEA